MEKKTISNKKTYQQPQFETVELNMHQPLMQTSGCTGHCDSDNCGDDNIGCGNEDYD